MNNNQIIIYQTDDDQTQIDVRLENVGYRVKSQRDVQLRQWANRVLKQYFIKKASFKMCLY